MGKEVEVLFEKREGDFIKGHTTNFMVVKIPYENLENEIVKVKVIKQEKNEPIGKRQGHQKY